MSSPLPNRVARFTAQSSCLKLDTCFRYLLLQTLLKSEKKYRRIFLEGKRPKHKNNINKYTKIEENRQIHQNFFSAHVYAKHKVN